MASLQKTIEILFTGSDAGLGRTVGNVGKQIEGLTNSVGSVTGPIADWSKSLVQAEGALLGMGVAMAGVAVNQAGQFRESVVEIGTLFNGTADQVGLLQDQILEYSKNSTSSIDEINGAVYQAISTGTDWENAIAAVSQAEVLATAGREDLQAVTTLLAGAMNAYGASVDEASDYSDVLFTTVQKGATSLPELANSLAGVTSVASAAKVPFADVNAAIAALTAGGTSTSESVTKLKALLTELLKPSDELAQALGGVTLEGDGLDGVMRKLLDVTGGSATEMVKLFGSTEAVQAALVLATDSAGNYTGALQAMEERSGAASTAAEKFAKEFENINQTLMNRIGAAFTEAGLPILDTYADVVDGIGQIFNSVSFSIKDGAFSEIYAAIDAGGDQLTELLTGIAEILPEALKDLNFDDLLSALDTLGTEIGQIFGGLDLTKAEDLRIALQALVNGVTAMTNYSAEYVDSLQPLLTMLGKLANYFTEGDQSLIKFAGTIGGLATALDLLLPAASTAADAMILFGGARGIGGAALSVGKLVPLLANPVTGLVAVIGGLLYLANDTRPLNDFIRGIIGLETSVERAAREQRELNQSLELFRAAMNGDAQALRDADEATRELYEAKQWAAGIEERLAEGVAFSSKSYEEQVAILADAERAQEAINKINEEGRKRDEERTEAVRVMAEAWGEFTDSQKALLSETEKATYAAAAEEAERQGLLTVVEDTNTAKVDEAKALEKEKQLRQEAAQALFGQRQQLLDHKAVMEEIASDERLRIIEFQFNMEIEQLRQEGETARAIISSIGETVNSTGEALVGLAELLTGFSSTSSSGYREIMEIIQNEETRRDEAIKMQQELTRAQVDQMDAQTQLLRQRADAYARGDAAITINGEGLQPHLEAFMWEILETLQVRVNAEGHAMLLGV
jgi:TP901 family phage tail tape measure protein